MANQWFYKKDGRKLGPVTSRQLKQLATTGGLRPTDLIWKEGLPEWRAANAAKGLFPEPEAAPTPQPPPLAEPTQPDIFDNARAYATKAAQAMAQLKAKAQTYHEKTTTTEESTTSAAAEIGSELRQIGLGCFWTSLGLACLLASFVVLATLSPPRPESPLAESSAEIVEAASPKSNVASVVEPPAPQDDPAGSSDSSAHHEAGYLTSPKDHPPPVLEYLARGQEVWLLDGCYTGDVVQTGVKKSLYVAIKNGVPKCVITKDAWNQSMLSLLPSDHTGVSWASYFIRQNYTLVSGSLNSVETWFDSTKPQAEFNNLNKYDKILLSHLSEIKVLGAKPGSGIETTILTQIDLEFSGDVARWRLEASSSRIVDSPSKGRIPFKESRSDSGYGRRLSLSP